VAAVVVAVVVKAVVLEVLRIEEATRVTRREPRVDRLRRCEILPGEVRRGREERGIERRVVHRNERLQEARVRRYHRAAPVGRVTEFHVGRGVAGRQGQAGGTGEGQDRGSHWSSPWLLDRRAACSFVPGVLPVGRKGKLELRASISGQESGRIGKKVRSCWTAWPARRRPNKSRRPGGALVGQADFSHFWCTISTAIPRTEEPRGRPRSRALVSRFFSGPAAAPAQ